MQSVITQLSAVQYTDAIAIFDLLDIHLVHGWLVDPQVIHPISILSITSPTHHHSAFCFCKLFSRQTPGMPMPKMLAPIWTR